MASCPVCGGARTGVYFKGREHTLSRDAFGPSRTEVAMGDVLRCGDCGLGFTALRPADGQLAEFYREMDVGVYEGELPGRLRTARRHLAILNRCYRGRPGRLLEVGCASGRFLDLTCNAGWECTGVEPSEVLCGEARRVLGDRARVIGSTLQDAGLAEGAFDVVAMFDVLEHVPEPVGFLHLVASFIKPGGMLLMNLPDLDSPQARLLGRRWPLLLPEHLNYFNKPSLSQVARSAGLRRVTWGRRPGAFSAGFVLYRLSQHDIPGVQWVHRWFSPIIGKLVVPVYMGELWSVWRKG